MVMRIPEDPRAEKPSIGKPVRTIGGGGKIVMPGVIRKPPISPIHPDPRDGSRRNPIRLPNPPGTRAEPIKNIGFPNHPTPIPRDPIRPNGLFNGGTKGSTLPPVVHGHMGKLPPAIRAKRKEYNSAHGGRGWAKTAEGIDFRKAAQARVAAQAKKAKRHLTTKAGMTIRKPVTTPGAATNAVS